MIHERLPSLTGTALGSRSMPTGALEFRSLVILTIVSAWRNKDSTSLIAPNTQREQQTIIVDAPYLHGEKGYVAKRSTSSRKSRSRRTGRRRVQIRSIDTAQLSKRNQSAYDRALHAIAAMRRDPGLRLTTVTKLHGVKVDTIRKYFPSELTKSHGRLRARKSDRYSASVYLPDRHGNSVPVLTRSSKERKQASQYLRDLGRYLRGDRNALSEWHGRKIANVELVTAGRAIKAIEPALSDFSLYRTLNGGAA